MTTPRLTTGADVIWNSPGHSSGLPVSSLISPSAAEIGAGNAGAGIERDHADVVGAHEDPRAAGGAFGGLIVDPIGDAAAIVAVGRALAGR